jgi:8-oxo-dGTP pyrophosphatase MutT (NUDIX family)
MNIKVENILVNLRSAVIIETENGYIFEKDKIRGIYFIVGGGIEINESSEEAAKREIFEELGIRIENIKLKAIIERFFENESEKFHEIGFYYFCKINEKIILPEGFYFLNTEEIKKVTIKPEVIHEIIGSKNNGIIHLIINR